MVSYYKSFTSASSGGPSASTPASSSSTSIVSRKQDMQQHPPRRDQPKRKLQALYSDHDRAALPRPLTALHPRPIPNSYWATPLLLACEYPWTPAAPHKPKLDALLRAGVRTFIDLTESGELVPYAGLLAARCALLGIPPAEVEYRRFAIRDRGLPASRAHLQQVLDALRAAAARGRVAAVHCRGGIGRTGTVVGCWLVESGVARDGAEALDIIAREWQSVEKCARYPHSPETGAQVEFVAGFHPTTKCAARALEIEAA